MCSDMSDHLLVLELFPVVLAGSGGIGGLKEEARDGHGAEE